MSTPSLAELPLIADEELIRRAEAAMNAAFAPFSGFRVGAALLTAEGEVFTGCNLENYSLSLSICAERVALIKALSEGRRNFTRLAVVASGAKLITPCGACRQMLWEFAPELTLVLTDRAGGKKTVAIAELLPLAFSGDEPWPPTGKKS